LIVVVHIEAESVAKIVEAVYENGVLKPLEKLDLRDGQRVKIMIVEKDFIEVAREIRMHLGKKLREKDLVEELVYERERFGW
jgi:predicted DNA-binding antitoxin AbrB/MazE fold protein